MATPKSIPSKINPDGTKIEAASGNSLYITALLKSAILKIDSIQADGLGPVSLSSPIVCKEFDPTDAGQIAYYEQ